ncbi:MAG: hypothetical protein AAFZ74_02065 [Pseudomonadota bacterium]
MAEITATTNGVLVRRGGSYVGKHVSGSPVFKLQVDLGIGFNNVQDSSGNDIEVTSSATLVQGGIEFDGKYRWSLDSGSGTIDQNFNIDGSK